MTDHAHDHGGPTCLELAERVSEYIDEELPPELRAQVAAHLAACSRCVQFVESLRRTRDLVRLLPPDPLSPERLRDLTQAAKRRLEE